MKGRGDKVRDKVFKKQVKGGIKRDKVRGKQRRLLLILILQSGPETSILIQ